MAELKREYVVPLRRKSRTAPKWRRSKKAVVVLKDFMRQHMKSENIIVCNELNEHIWARGSKNPPGKVSVVALKTSVNGEEKVLVNLLSVGIDKQKQTYQKDLPKQEEVKEAEVVKEEPKTQETKTEEKPVKEEEKKTAKKEVKQNE